MSAYLIIQTVLALAAVGLALAAVILFVQGWLRAQLGVALVHLIGAATAYGIFATLCDPFFRYEATLMVAAFGSSSLLLTLGFLKVRKFPLPVRETEQPRSRSRVA